jgi:heptose-I-phosphate ethanolaminephosphotransferase
MKLLKILGQTASKAFYPIKANTAFFLFMFVLGTACSQLEVPPVKHPTVYAHATAELFVDLYLLCLLLALIPTRIRRWVRGAVGIVLYATAIVDVYCFVKFGSKLTPTMLLLVGETNGNEATEFLSTYLSWDIICTELGWILLIAFVHALWAAVYRYLKRRKRWPGVRLTPAYQLLAESMTGIAVVAMLASACQQSWPNKKAMYRLMSYDNIGDVEHELTRPDKAEQYLPIYRLAFSIYANRLAAKQIDRLVAATGEARVDSCSFRSRNIVLIIGESFNKHHSQLYGYDMPTTPRQLQRSATGQLIPFTDVVSPWNLTSFVFKNVFSMHCTGDSGEWCDYPLFPQLFRQSGYHVTFITNQFLPQAREAVFDFSGGFFLNNPALSKKLFDTRNTSLHTYDEGVLRDYDRLKPKRGNHNLILFHLKGQHVTYRDRVPRHQRKLKNADYNRPELNNRARYILADYDNATLYNDSIVDAIIKRFENEDAIVIYMPDHAEECFGDGINVFGRLHSAAIDYRLAKEEFEIPFWIWCSGKYIAAHPDIYGEVAAARRRPYMIDRLPHLLLYLAGIHAPSYKEHYNVLAPGYNAQAPRMLKATVDYNKLQKK